VFNQLTAAEVVTAIGSTLQTAARNDDRTSDFGRDQLMSAYSATRHLAVELSSYEPELHAFTAAVARSVRAAEIPELRDDLAAFAARVDSSPDARALGAELCELLQVLRERRSEETDALRDEIHVHLRALADREVDLLADALG
jgi:hypothetical protein